MATIHDHITEAQADLIRGARLFFVATADPSLAPSEKGLGPVNVSPKGSAPLHVVSPNEVAYLDYPGSGNETARHASSGGPVTLMVCSFEGVDAAIVRLYGRARVSSLRDSPLAARLLQSAAEELTSIPRQIISVVVDRTQTSCGYGVPVMHFVRDRRRDDRGRRYKT